MKPPGRALILAKGVPPGRNLLRKIARRADIIVATDGAYRKALGLGVRPDWIIGDFDSLPKNQALKPGVRTLYDHDQNASDLEKAVRFLQRKGCLEAWILGATGGRLDHTICAFQVMEKYSGRSQSSRHLGRRVGVGDSDTWGVRDADPRRCSGRMRLVLFERSFSAEIVSGKHALRCAPGEVISLFPLGRARVSISGVKYPLTRHWLTPGSRGVSNRAASSKVNLRVSPGRIWLIRGNGAWLNISKHRRRRTLT